VVLLTLRAKKIQEAQTINDLLLTPDDELKTKVYKDIVKNSGEKICFILEGYDELPNQLRKSSVFTELREYLPNCTLVYTSRPIACSKLESIASRIIKIEGFNKKSVDEYISNTFADVTDGKKFALKLKSQLHQNFILQEVMNVPINVAIVCLIFFYYSTLPETLTELYTLLCLRLILRHIVTRTANVAQIEVLRSLNHLPKDIAEQFSQLCFIAYKGVKSDKMIFSSCELRTIGVVQEKMSDLGLLVAAPSTSVYGREKSYNFLHKTLQEFCTAWYISKLSLKDQLKCINTYWDDDNYIMVWRFYSGITGLNNKEILNCVLPYKLVESYLTKGRVQHFMSCMYEAHNNELCQIVGDHFDANIRYGAAHVIGYFLTYYKGIVKEVHSKHWCDHQFQVLVQSLQRRRLHNDNDSLVLNISYCCVTHSSFSLLVQLLSTQSSIAELKMREIKFQPISDVDSFCDSNKTSSHLSNMQALSRVFINSNTLRVLDVTMTDIGPNGAACFADLRNVFIPCVIMAGCKLGPTGADKIGEMLYHNNSIVSIDLSSNLILDSGVERLVYHLNVDNKTKLQSLNLWGNQITAVGANHLKKLIATNHSTLTSIELSWNPLRDKGVLIILSSLTVTMDYIGLWRVSMTSSSCPIIGASLNKIKSTSFDLPDDCEVISDSLADTTVLKQLELYNICSDSASCKMLNAIRTCDNVEALKLDYQYLKETVADIIWLLECSKSLKHLTIKCRNQSPQDILKVADSLTFSSSIKIFKYFVNCMNQATALKFLDQLQQAYTVEKVTLGVTEEAANDHRFLGEVEKCVQQINHIRSTKCVSNLLMVELALFYDAYCV